MFLVWTGFYHENFVNFFQECADIDECAEHSSACVPNSVCINTVVSKLKICTLIKLTPEFASQTE